MISIPKAHMVRSIVFGIITMSSSLALAALSAWLIVRAWQQPGVLRLTIAITSVRGLGISRALFRYCERVYTHQAYFSSLRFTQINAYHWLAISDSRQVFQSSIQVAQLCDTIARSVALVISPYAVAIIIAIITVVFFSLLSLYAGIVMVLAMLLVIGLVPLLSLCAQSNFVSHERKFMQEFTYYMHIIVEHREELLMAGQLDSLLAKAKTALMYRDKYLKRSFFLNACAMAIYIVTIGIAVCGCIITTYIHHNQLSAPMIGVMILLPLSAFEAASVLPLAAHHYSAWKLSEKYLHQLCISTDSLQELHLDCAKAQIASAFDSDKRLCLIIGSNGSGKTTLLLELAGLISRCEPAVRSQIALLQQKNSVAFLANSHCFATSIRENLFLSAPNVDDEQLWLILGYVGLADKVISLPKGLDDSADDFSAGQLQLLHLAQYFLSSAEVKFLDEPSENLSEGRREKIYDLLLNDADPAFRVITTHDAQLITQAELMGYKIIDLDHCAC